MRSLLSWTIACFFIFILAISFTGKPAWESKFISVNKNGSLKYAADEKGNTIPDFSRVGFYAGDKAIPAIEVVKTISPAQSGSSENIIQSAIAEVAAKPVGKDGYRGTILLKKGIYKIPGAIKITASGIVLRGEGDETILIAEGTSQRALIDVSGSGNIEEVTGSRTAITDEYIPAGSQSFTLASAANFTVGDKIILLRPGTDTWVKDLKMDVIEERNGTKQWQAKEYDLRFERVITKIEKNKVYIDNPVVMPMETKYGGGYIYKYNFKGRINQVGVEDLQCRSEYTSDTAENHSWDAVKFDKIENGWVRNITARHFAYSCVNLDDGARNITVDNCRYLEPKSVITGGRRYSFNVTGQLNLVMNCHAEEGRHDYVTGARVCGPNVFYNSTAVKTHADIGPHHRWAMGTLYDNIKTDGEINVQDRGNWGSGHGWAGVTQVIWNCNVKAAAIQNPWASGKNYCIGLKGDKKDGRLKGRPDAEWEGQNKDGLQPASLYMAQLKARK
jgi:hypothetical protein